MRALNATIRLLGAVNASLLAAGRTVGWLLLMGMVAIILAQVFWRYQLNNALPWAEEGARALMIWMMALVAPSAYRRAGFVAIDLVPDLLPARARALLMLAILGLSLAALVVLAGHAWTHFSSPILFNSSGLNRLLQDTGINAVLGTELEFRTSYIYLAMSVGTWLLIAVNVELMLRQIGQLLGADTRAEPAEAEGAEPVVAE